MNILTSLRRYCWRLLNATGRLKNVRRLLYKNRRLLFALAWLYRRTLIRHVRIVAVVGSVGKTTTLRVASAALGVPVEAVMGYNNSVFVALHVLRILPWKRRAVMEVGIGAPGQMREYAKLIRPQIVIVAAIASDHNRSLFDLEMTRDEKAEMVRVLLPDGVAFLNGDDENVLWMGSQTAGKVITYGFGEQCDVRLKERMLNWPDGSRLTIAANEEVVELHTRFFAPVSAYSFLAAVAVSLFEKIDEARFVAACEAIEPSFARLEAIRLPQGAILIRDDYKSSMETMEAALDTMAEIPAKRKIVLLGSITEPVGPQGPLYRHLGSRVADVADIAIFYGSNDKTYRPGAERGGMPREAIIRVKNSIQDAIKAVPEDLGEGDVILIKGRDRERLARVALQLLGKDVKCSVPLCPIAHLHFCDTCELLEKGWNPKYEGM